MAPTLCGAVVKSRRGLLAFGWSTVTLLTFISFITAFISAMSGKNVEYNNDGGNDNNEEEDGDDDDNSEDAVAIAVTSRAMVFSAFWTAALAGMMSMLGMVVLGFQSPTGKYYWCCADSVHRTTPLTLGAFIGSLLMFANLTLVCSVLFGEFQIHDYNLGGGENWEKNGGYAQDRAMQRSSIAFSIMCMFLTVLYAGFAALVFTFSSALLEENRSDARAEALSPSDPNVPAGYIRDDRFNVSGTNTLSGGGFVKPQQSDSSLA